MGNPYESGARKLIPAVLVYVRSRGRILMIHREDGGFHDGKWNGLGGKLDADESPLEAARRELREESGLDLPEKIFTALGTLTFPLFKPQRSEDWVCYVFYADLPQSLEEQQLVASVEGKLHWVLEDDLARLNLWPGDLYFMPYVQRREPFIGTIWYRDGKVARHWMEALKGRK